MNKPEYLASLKELVAKATPGECRVRRVDGGDGSMDYEVIDDAEIHIALFAQYLHDDMKMKANAELYAESRTAIPYLLTALEERHFESLEAIDKQGGKMKNGDMNVHQIDFIVEEVISKFDFTAVFLFMQTTGWTWRNNAASPAKSELEKQAKELLREAIHNGIGSSSGGFEAYYDKDDNAIGLRFVAVEADYYLQDAMKAELETTLKSLLPGRNK